MDIATNKKRTIATRKSWEDAVEEVDGIRRRWPPRLKVRFGHEIRAVEVDGGQ
ncbi:MAG: hypothetical protein ACLFVJ_20520 [Persicimonas sp.]